MNGENYLLKNGLTFFILVFSLFIYLSTLCPTIFWSDAPEFVTVSYTLGIPHPAGFPTYTLLSKIITFLPLGGIAYKVNLVSALSASLTVFLLFLVMSKLIRIFYNHANPLNIDISAFLISLLFLFSTSFWINSSVTEVYTMFILFLVSIIFLALMWYESKDNRYLFFGSFVYGLSAGVHATTAFFLPGLLIFFVLTRDKKTFAKDIFFIIFFFILGFSSFLYLPLRSTTNPTFDWGNTETLKQFLIHITDQKDSDYHFVYRKNILYQILNYFKLLIEELTIIGILCSLIGFVYSFKKSKPIFFLLFFIFLGNVSFFIAYWKNGTAYMPSFLILSIWSCLGLYLPIRWAAFKEGKFHLKRLIIIITIIFILFSFIKDYNRIDKSDYTTAYTTAKENYSGLGINSIVLSTVFWFPFRYLQDVERLRDDISIILHGDITDPIHFNPISQKRYPRLVLPKEELDWYSYYPELISSNIGRYPIYWETQPKLDQYIFPYLKPEKFLFRVYPEKIDKIPDEILDAYYEQLKEFLEKEFDKIDYFEDMFFGVYYNYFIEGFVLFLMEHKRYEEAINLYKLVNLLKPDNAGVLINLGVCYANLRNYQKSEEYFLKGLKIDKCNVMANFNLGVNYIDKKEYARAIETFNYLLEIDENNARARYGLGLCYTDRGEYDRAIREFKIGKSILESKDIIEISDKRLRGDVLKELEIVERLKIGITQE